MTTQKKKVTRNFNTHYNKNNPWKPVLLYGFFGVLWILFSDSLLSFFVNDPKVYANVQTIKGWFFILITSFFLYLFIRIDNRIIYALNKKLTLNNKELEQQRILIKEIYKQSNAVIMIWSIDGIMVEINDYFTELLGYNEEDIIGKNWIRTIVPTDQQHEVSDIVNLLKSERQLFNIAGDIISKDGSRLNIIWNDAMLDTQKNGQQLIASYGFNVTREQEQEKEIYHLAYSDKLTKLNNSAVYEKKIIELKEDSIPFTTYLIDIDNFKRLNEVHGHNYGDQLLIEYANILKDALIHHHIYRWSGDQFIIIEETISPQAVQLTIDNLQSLSHREWNFNGIKFNSTVSIGITSFPKETIALTDIYRNAEIALYSAKDNGKACYQFYDKSMYEEIEFINFVEHELTNAITNNELELYLQPIYELESNTISSYEVLLRWFNEKLPNTHIGRVIEIAEKTEQIMDIDRWVIHNSLKMVEDNQVFFRNSIVSINLSAQSFKSSSFIDLLIDEAYTHNIIPGRIQLEITEHSIIQDINHSGKLMHRLKKAGFILALDDFGTRYSSLNYLSKLPFDTLKLDKSYIDYLLLDKNDHKIITMLIQLSHQLDLVVVAEGIEEQEQFDELKKIGCNYGQGYLMAKPNSLSKLLKE